MHARAWRRSGKMHARVWRRSGKMHARAPNPASILLSHLRSKMHARAPTLSCFTLSGAIGQNARSRPNSFMLYIQRSDRAKCTPARSGDRAKCTLALSGDRAKCTLAPQIQQASCFLIALIGVFGKNARSRLAAIGQNARSRLAAIGQNARSRPKSGKHPAFSFTLKNARSRPNSFLLYTQRSDRAKCTLVLSGDRAKCTLALSGDRAQCTLAPRIQHARSREAIGQNARSRPKSSMIFFSCLHLAERSGKTHGRALRQSGIQPCVRSRFARR
jgi:hypothetical protein